MQRVLQLITLFSVLSLPFLPILAQNQFGTSTLPPDLTSAQVRHFDLPAELHFAPPPASLNFVPDVAPLPVSSNLSSYTPTVLVASVSRNPLLLPTDSCSSPSQFSLFSACLALPSTKFTADNEKLDVLPIMPIQPSPRPNEKMHWNAAFWQSFGFLVAGHAFRFGMDSGARYLLYHKPFWHDYWASAGNFNMDHWGDGDDFLVNYIGHPMEGAVYGYILVNNDPRGRSARFGKSSNYWYSRLKAMGWATVWEAYFEIGPIFSEAAFGNEGGYFYYPGCGRTLCDKPHKPITNNTGWVDFVTTPLVGMGWMVMEDAIEREFVDRIAKDSPALKYKILRGSLAPSHTFANLFAGKTPWFRYPEEGSFQQTFGGPLHPAERPAWKDEPRFSLSAQYMSMQFPLDSESCHNCKQFYSGYGFDFSYRLAKYAWVDTVVNLFPGSGSFGEHGAAQEGLAGFKLGRSIGDWGIYSNLRTGFIHYDKALVPGSTTNYESGWRYALDLGGTIEYAASRNSVLRFNAGTTLIHYLQPYTDPEQPPISVISTQYYSFHGSPYLTTGYVFRF